MPKNRNRSRLGWKEFLMAFALLCSFAAAGEPETACNASGDEILHFGGCGGVYFLLDPGPFWVELEKYDLNKTNRKTFLRAVLAGPDRAILSDGYIPADGRPKGSGPGPVQRMRLSAAVPRTGVYALNVTCAEDRYGDDIAWGFRTNARQYLVETSRGHRDAAHEEPLVLSSPGKPGDVCFMPNRSAFSVKVSGLPANNPPLGLYDDQDRLVAEFSPDAQGAAQYALSADPTRSGRPWRLHLPSFCAVVHIDGVTRWPEGSDYPGLSLWTPKADSWFPFHENRWPLTPYQKTNYGENGAAGRMTFDVYNNALFSRTFLLSLEFPEELWPAALSATEVSLPPRGKMPVVLTYSIPETGDAWKCHICIRSQEEPQFTTYATAMIRRGTPPAARPFAAPLVLKPYFHENEQLGYDPDYPCTGGVYFDTKGRPFVCAEDGVFQPREGGWMSTAKALSPTGISVPVRLQPSKVAFDSTNNVYTTNAAGRYTGLLYSRNAGLTFSLCPIAGPGTFDIEQFSGHNTPEAPPPIARYTLTEKDPNLFWRRLYDLDLFLPGEDPGGGVHAGEPISITKKCIGFSAHSGLPSSLVSREGKVHVAWAEATPPEAEVEGVPTFVVTYDRRGKVLGQPALVGYGPPANDVHNTPSITIDSKGYLHVLVGTHGRTFKYARSLLPNDAGGGWTAPEELAPGLRQTYVGLVCDQEDVLHLVFRLWLDDDVYFPAGIYATLAHMSKRPGSPWTKARPLVIPPFSEYSVYYHRFTIDRAGRLFLSYDYWSTYWFYRNDHPGTRRALMMSADGGSTWQLAANEFWQH